MAFDYFVADNIRTNDEKRKRPCVLQQTLEFDDSYCIAESDACAGSCSRCVYAWRNGPELYVGGVSGNTDSVCPEYVSGSSNSKSGNSGGTVLGEKEISGLWMLFSVWRFAYADWYL